MAKTFATVIGVVFILVEIVGFFSPNLMDAHLGTLHNVIHLVSGAASLYFGTKRHSGIRALILHWLRCDLWAARDLRVFARFRRT